MVAAVLVSLLSPGGWWQLPPCLITSCQGHRSSRSLWGFFSSLGNLPSPSGFLGHQGDIYCLPPCGDVTAQVSAATGLLHLNGEAHGR